MLRKTQEQKLSTKNNQQYKTQAGADPKENGWGSCGRHEAFRTKVPRACSVPANSRRISRPKHPYPASRKQGNNPKTKQAEFKKNAMKKRRCVRKGGADRNNFTYSTVIVCVLWSRPGS